MTRKWRRLRGPVDNLTSLYWAICPQIATPRPHREILERRVGDRTSDVVEVAVDSVRASVLKRCDHVVGSAPVDGDIETQFLLDVAALLVGAGDAHDMTAGDLADLAHHASHRSRGSSNHQRITCSWCQYFQGPEIGGETGHAEHAKGGRDGRGRSVQPSDIPCCSDAESLPSDGCGDELSRTERTVV